MAKKDKKTDVPNEQRDDALFEKLGRHKRRKKRKLIITIVCIVLVLAVVAVLGVTYLQRQVREEYATTQGEVLSYEVTTGSISTVVSGSGSLTDVDLLSVTVPEGVEITEIAVKANQTVSEGDILAMVDSASVVSAMAELQEQIEALDAQLSDAEDDAASTTVNAGVSGRVMAIFAETDAAVTDVMYEHGALALLSLDGYMAVELETDALSTGDSVSVSCADGDYSGTVERVVDGKATILVSDDGPAYEEAVTVVSADGTELGSGTLSIHSALRITGYAGTIADVEVSVGEEVSDSTTLFTLEDTAYSANYNSLLRERAELEETLLELLSIQRDGAVLASISGSVYSVDHSESAASSVVTLSADEKMSVTISVDEADILSLQPGQTVTVSVSSVSEDAFDGTLTEINRTGSSGAYSAVIELEKAEGMLAGMTASVSVRIEGVDDAILIPIEALHKTSDGAYVYTSYNEEYQEYGGKVDVVTGLENSTYIEIKSGLGVGDTVYYTEQESTFGGFGGFGGMGGMSGFPGSGEMPDFGGGEMPDFGGGEMPDFGGGGGRGGSGSFPGGFGG